MPLFSRNKGKSSGGRGRKPKRDVGGNDRGKRRGRGRGDQRPRVKNGSTFDSTRLEEQQGSDGEGGDNVFSSDHVEDVLEESEVSIDDEDIDLSREPFKPYNTLLQTLIVNHAEGEPQLKKRKIEIQEAAPQQTDTVTYDLDVVEEPEDIEDFGADIEDTEDFEGDRDPFVKHIAELDETSLSQQIADIADGKWRTNITNEEQWSCYIKVPQSSPNTTPKATLEIDDMILKRRLKESAKRAIDSLDRLTGLLTSSIFNYRDVIFPMRSSENTNLLRTLTCLHLLNHIFKTRDKIIKNNARLTKENDEDVEFRDQGFTRPKILVILPTRESCAKYVDTLLSLCEPEQQENKKRFQDSYISEESVSKDKPDDFRDLFAGNDDDMFRLGLKFTRKTVKFFAQFYNSDIIFASPLGLRMALGADNPKKQDHDFLSSIEIVILDQADAVAMQNWEHVELIFEKLNLQPKEAHGCDFSRVRNWYLDGNAKYVRQTVLLSAFNFPALNKLFNHDALNVEGKLIYNCRSEGMMIDLGVNVKQTFSRFNVKSPVTDPDDRFEYFSSAVVPSLLKHSKHGAGAGPGILIYLPSYTDFVRIRNYLSTSRDTQNVSFGSISEYTSSRDAARARSHFVSGRHSILLYTERAHHFRRYHLKGIKRVILYGLPENPIFYKEVVGGFLSAGIITTGLDAQEASAKALFSKLDIMKLERIVGSSRFVSMLKEKTGDTFDFM